MHTAMEPIFFETQEQFRTWLETHGSTETEVWVGFYKKKSGKIGINYDQALEEALCFGWIDGIAKSRDEVSYMQRFTPRRTKSMWSKINTRHIERLTKLGKMMPAGIAAVEAAKKDGRWQQAYDSPSTARIPDEFLKKLDENPNAKAFYATLNKANVYAIGHRLQTAKKPETKTKRIGDIISMLNKREKWY